MIRNDGIWIGNNIKGEPVVLPPKMANRHGLVSGATGTGKTVTIKVLAEAFSDLGVPVFMADIKGDVSSMMKAGVDTEDMQKRRERFSLDENGFEYKGYPVEFWDLYGENGISLRSTVSEMGPLLLSRILGLNDLQRDILTVVFKVADDNGLLLIDLKDLKAMLTFCLDHASELKSTYGMFSTTSVSVIIRAIVALEMEGGEGFFTRPELDFDDWFRTENDMGVINILDSSSLIQRPRLYSAFMLWMISELFERLPEVGDPEKPKMVFFFDEAHLLFDGAGKTLIEKIEQMIKLIRSKGVGVYFCTQSPSDVPDEVLAQLNNKIQHGLRAYTPKDQRAVRAAASSFRENSGFDTYETILSLGTGEAVISFLDEKGIPKVVEKTFVIPPQSYMGTVTKEEIREKASFGELYKKYREPVDDESAYEVLGSVSEAEETAAAEKAKKEDKKPNKTAKQVGKTVAGTIGRELGKSFGKLFGSFGKTLGGNVGATLGRGLLETLLKK